MEREDLIAPERYNIVMEIEKHAEKEGLIALQYGDSEGNEKQVTYKELIDNVNRVCNAMLESSLKRGDKVLITVPRIIEAYEVYLACLKTGIIIIPSSDMLTTGDLQYRVSHAEANGVITYYPHAKNFEGLKQFEELHTFIIGEARPGWKLLDDLKVKASSELEMADTTRDDIAFLPYTSGTTGSPKGVVHTHAWGYAHLRTVAKDWLAIREGDRVWATAAPGWQKWVWSPLLAVLGSGATGFIYNGRYAAQDYMKLVEETRITVVCCTPTEYRMMAKLPNMREYNLAALRSSVSAGEPLNREVIELFEQHHQITVRDGYGQTENTLLLGIMEGMEVKPGSMGRPTPGNEVVVVDDTAVPVAPGVVGDIAVKRNCPALFKHYYKDRARTEQALRGEYYITGDRAQMDEDGYFWFEGRDDDIIVSSGYTIGPFEVEDVLVKHPAVQECAVVASP